MANGRRSLIGAESAGTLIQVIILTLCCYAIAQLSLAAAVNLSTFHIDGAYQTASGLFRLQAGELPGRDFFPYLGTGVLLTLYPAFLAFGGDLAASTAGAHLMVALSQGMSLAVIVFLCAPPLRRILWALSLGLLLIALAMLLSHPPALLAERLHPGNSLRPLRSALPYIAALPVFLALTWRSLASFAVLGMLAGVAMIWSNDFALPVAFHCGLAALALMVAGADTRYRLQGAALFAAMFLLGLLPLVLATGGHPVALFTFNFVDVAGDQWWYFGPWVESCRLFFVTDLPALVSTDNLAGLAVLLALAVTAWFKRTPAVFTLLWVGSTLLLGGILASVGGHFGGYFTPFQFWGFMVLAGLILRLVTSWIPALTNMPQRTLSALLLVPLVIAGYLAYAGHRQHQDIQAEAHQEDQLYVPELGGYLPPDWQDYVELARSFPSDTTVLEEYWGIWSAINRSQPLLPVDSAIHALGSVREQGREVMAEAPDIVITTLPAHSPWQSWSLSTNWWLYQPLLANYEPLATSPHTVVWQRAEAREPATGGSCEVNLDGISVTATVPERGYYELQLEHRALPGGRRITMLHTAVPYAAGADGWLALPPGSTSSLAPVFAPAAGEHSFATRVTPDSVERDGLQISACSLRGIAQQTPYALKNIDTPFPLDDDNWSAGVSRQRASFVIASSMENLARFAPGAILELGAGEQRSVETVVDGGPWLEVFLDGGPLDAGTMGFPHRFAVSYPEGVQRQVRTPERICQTAIACVRQD